jgi:hypothetical protein
MTKPKLMARTPNNTDVNTLPTNYEDILAAPALRRYAIIEYGVSDITTPVHGGDAVPRLQIVHWEDMAPEAITPLLDQAFTARTGQAKRPSPDEVGDTPLPLGEAEWEAAAPK